MKEYSYKNLDIVRLLTFGDLDVRSIAEQNPALTADDYFSRIEQFIDKAPLLDGIFESVTRYAEGIRAAQSRGADAAPRPDDLPSDVRITGDLQNLKSILSVIGCKKLDAGIDEICLAIKDGRLGLAEKLAGESAASLDAIIDRIRLTFPKKRFKSPPPPPPPEDEDSLPEPPTELWEAILYFDELEENRKPRILAVDDVAVVLNKLTSLLSPYYEVYALKNSSQVESFLAHTTPELFLLDIEMNELNGFELVPIIRQFEKHKDTPIIFLTGNASVGNLKDAVALGACDFITKPVNKEVLLDKIAQNIVKRKQY